MERNTLKRMFDGTFTDLVKRLPPTQENMVAEATTFSDYFIEEFSNIPLLDNKNHEEYYKKVNSLYELLNEKTTKVSNLLRELGILTTLVPQVLDKKIIFIPVRYNVN